MALDTITRKDLMAFRVSLLEDIQGLLEVQSPHQPKWLVKKEISKRYGVSSSTLYNWQVAGHLTYSKIEGTIYYNVECLENLIERNQVKSFQTLSK